MRKILLTLAVLGILMGMSNCETGVEPMSADVKVNPFVGEWVNTHGEVYNFTETRTTVYTKDEKVFCVGDYTYTDHDIIITTDLENSIWNQTHWIFPYTISGDLLFLNGGLVNRKTE